jgi:hypothetical protein
VAAGEEERKAARGMLEGDASGGEGDRGGRDARRVVWTRMRVEINAIEKKFLVRDS